jgi:hypothetical protein
MAFIDDRGRVLGRLNVFDAAVAVGIVAALALAGIGYRLLQVPLPPRVTDVSPKVVTESSSLRITIKGENLMPYMHVYVQRTGEPTQMMHDPLRWVRSDPYTPVNGARTAFRLESPTLAEIETLDDLLPGTYDLIFKDETKLVGIAHGAFTVLPAPKLEVVSKYREAIVRVAGAFVGLTPDDAQKLKAGDSIPPGAVERWGDVVSVGAVRPDNARIDIGAAVVDAQIVNRSEVPAELRLRCVIARGKCYAMDQPMVVGETVKLQVAGGVREFFIQKVTPETAAR